MKLLIIGHPRSGKTTLAAKTALEYHETHGVHISRLSTDNILKDYDWSAFSDRVCELLHRDGDWIIEGCSAVRGLRKYLRTGRPVDFAVLWLDKPYIPLKGNQIGFAANLDKIWKDCQELMHEKR